MTTLLSQFDQFPGRQVMITIQMILAEQPPPAAAVTEDDAVLVREAKRDLSAFASLYQRYADRVYRYLLVRVNNVHDAQDLTSQTFIAAMENLAKYRGTSPFIAWLLGIARHKAADQLRRNRPELVLEAANEVPDFHDTIEIVSQHLQIEQVASKMQLLSPDRAEALSLRLFGGLEVAEISRMMGKNEAAVRMLVYRGLQDLQDRLNPDGKVRS
jgi:RNA polymerase sigma-70 factor (ECF subfamily)